MKVARVLDTVLPDAEANLAGMVASVAAAASEGAGLVLFPEAARPRFVESAEAARAAGLGVNAGHDLNRRNLGAFCSAVPGVLKVSIGHALIADALELGLAATVRAYLDTLS